MPRHDLYDRELARFREVLKSDPKAALERYGLSLVNSLPADERVAAYRSLGIGADLAIDYFNLGVAAAKREDWNDAVANFRKAAEKDPSFADATFNLAICLEKVGSRKEAVAAWTSYADTLDSAEDKAAIKKHAQELAKA